MRSLAQEEADPCRWSFVLVRKVQQLLISANILQVSLAVKWSSIQHLDQPLLSIYSWSCLRQRSQRDCSLSFVTQRVYILRTMHGERMVLRENSRYIYPFFLWTKGNLTVWLLFSLISKLNFYFSRRIKWLLKLGETEIFDYSLISVLFQYSVHNYLEIKLICFKVSPRFTIYSTTGMLSIKMTKVYL